MRSAAVPTSLLVVVALGLLIMRVGIQGGAVLFVAGLGVTLVAAVAALVVVAMT